MKTLAKVFETITPTLKVEQMDDELMGIFMPLAIAEVDDKANEGVDPLYEEMLHKSWQLMAMHKRQQQLNMNYSKCVLMFLLYLVDSSIGFALLYMYYLQWKYKDTDVNLIDMKVLSYTFPSGFYTQDSILKLWDAQKVSTPAEYSDNMIDHNKYVESILNKQQ